MYITYVYYLHVQVDVCYSTYCVLVFVCYEIILRFVSHLCIRIPTYLTSTYGEDLNRNTTLFGLSKCVERFFPCLVS